MELIDMFRIEKVDLREYWMEEYNCVAKVDFKWFHYKDGVLKAKYSFKFDQNYSHEFVTFLNNCS